MGYGHPRAFRKAANAQRGVTLGNVTRDRVKAEGPATVEVWHEADSVGCARWDGDGEVKLYGHTGRWQGGYDGGHLGGIGGCESTARAPSAQHLGEAGGDGQVVGN